MVQNIFLKYIFPIFLPLSFICYFGFGWNLINRNGIELNFWKSYLWVFDFFLSLSPLIVKFNPVTFIVLTNLFVFISDI